MSQAENLLDELSSEDISLYTVNPDTEEHIVIDDNRNITVPESLQRIAVQHDHNVETVTFDCPRYWDNHDLSEMYIYINYLRSDEAKGRYLTRNTRIDEENPNLIHFDWTVGNEITSVNGRLQFLVCAVKTDQNGDEELHWNTEINNEMVVSEGLEGDDVIPEVYSDIITYLLSRMDKLEEKVEEAPEDKPESTDKNNEIEIVDVLPEPSEEYRSVFKILYTEGKDTLYICLKIEDGYVWKPLTGVTEPELDDTSSVLGEAILGKMILQ